MDTPPVQVTGVGRQVTSLFRPVAGEHQDGQAEHPANQQVDDLEQHLASQPSLPQACCR